MVKEYTGAYRPLGNEPFHVTDDEYRKLIAKENPHLPVEYSALDARNCNAVAEIHGDIQELTVEQLQRGDPKALGVNFGESAAFFETIDSQGKRIIKIDHDNEMNAAFQNAEGTWVIKRIGKYAPLLPTETSPVQLDGNLKVPVDRPMRLLQILSTLVIPGGQKEPEMLNFGVINRITVVSKHGSLDKGNPTLRELPEGLPTSFFIPEKTHVAKRALRQAHASHRHTATKAS